MVASDVPVDRPIDFVLTRRALIGLIAYYVILLISGTGLALWSILTDDFSIRARGSIGGMAIAAAASSTYYLRRVYRSAISERLALLPKGERASAPALGVLLYLAVRPLIATLLALITVVGLLIGLVSAAKGTQLSEGFVLTSVLVCFTVGYSAGLVLQRLDKKGLGVLDKAMENGQSL